MATARKLDHHDSAAEINPLALDAAFLNANTFGDTILRTEIVGLFNAQLDGVSKNLMLPMDQKSWHYLTHTMKGAAAAVGAKEIVALADHWGRARPPATLADRQAYGSELRNCVAAFNKAAALLG